MMPDTIKILGIVTLVFIVIVSMDALGVFTQLFMMGEPAIRDLVKDQYPEYDADIEFVENCTICNGSTCKTYPGPCWKISVITEGDNEKTFVQMLMDAGGGVIDRSENPCVEWWCDAVPCRHVYSEQTDDVLAQYTNMDCGTADSTCDPGFGKCRSCLTGQDCVAEILTASPTQTIYRFEVLGTGEYADIDKDELMCRIFSRGSMIFIGSMGISECGSMMYGNTQCYDGSCDFVPEFDLIPN